MSFLNRTEKFRADHTFIFIIQEWKKHDLIYGKV